ncbi:hypothetical protein [Motilibacter aurantiacus]|uniref:hypothetical protein n=1 Tax=Motilibacter aurantiacus TaxID=2714955 RepID=UPI0014080C30|nr:hypothetical protein [Motilibacter aurantiacus]NHC45028.1 hypothetical protein [Motilibacter aurantiacus]
MGLLDKRRGPFGDGAASALLEPGERLLTSALTAAGEPVGVTDRALLLPGAERLPWHLVLEAAYAGDTCTLTVTAVAGARHVLALPDPGRVPEAVRERVQSSILVSRRVAVAGERGVLVAVRRVPDAAPAWQVRPEPGVDLGDPDVRSRVDAAIAQLRASLGL